MLFNFVKFIVCEFASRFKKVCIYSGFPDIVQKSR